MKIVVTGGSGFVGKRLEKIRPDWIYLSSKDYDLTEQQDVRRLFKDHSPQVIFK